MQRYTQSFLGLFEQSNDGEYVKYNSHRKTLEELKIEHGHYVEDMRDEYEELYGDYVRLEADFNVSSTFANIYAVLLSIVLVLVLLVLVFGETL